jgi:hypothetical protein
LVAVTQVAFQGFLTSTGGVPTNGNVSMVAKLYNAPSGGTQLWAETHPTVVVTNGIFQIALGSVTPLEIPDFTGSPIYLGIAVNGETELPRTRLLASPFAIRAAEADHALTADIAGDSVWEVNGANAFRLGGNVGIGLSTPTAKLDVDGPAGGLLSMKVDDQFFVDPTNSFVGVGRSNRITSAERFGVRSPAATGFGGMYVETQGVNALPFYGYATAGTAKAWHYFDGTTGNWNLHNNGSDRLSVKSDGNVGIGTTTPSAGLHVSHAGGVAFNNVGLRVHETGASSVGSWCATFSSDANTVLTQNGSGDILRAFNVGFNPVFKVLNSGEVVTPVLQITGGADVVESFDARGECEPGTVMVIDDESPGRLRASSNPYDRKVAGVVSGAGGVKPGIRLGQEGMLDGDTPVAMAGRVYVKCTTENGPIRAGDLLTTSARTGHAMRATDAERSHGAVIGKAMSALEQGEGLVLVLVNLQ